MIGRDNVPFTRSLVQHLHKTMGLVLVETRYSPWWSRAERQSSSAHLLVAQRAYRNPCRYFQATCCSQSMVCIRETAMFMRLPPTCIGLFRVYNVHMFTSCVVTFTGVSHDLETSMQALQVDRGPSSFCSAFGSLTVLLYPTGNISFTLLAPHCDPYNLQPQKWPRFGFLTNTTSPSLF